MAEVVLFHHAQGLTPGVVAFAEELRRAGHTVHTPDLFEGRTFGTIEEGRDAFYTQAIGAEPSYVVVRIEVDLRAEVRHPDQQVTVRIQAERLGTTSLITRETILTPSGEVAAEARVVSVRWDPGQHKPVPFSETERKRLLTALIG